MALRLRSSRLTPEGLWVPGFRTPRPGGRNWADDAASPRHVFQEDASLESRANVTRQQSVTEGSQRRSQAPKSGGFLLSALRRRSGGRCEQCPIEDVRAGRRPWWTRAPLQALGARQEDSREVRTITKSPTARELRAGGGLFPSDLPPRAACEPGRLSRPARPKYPPWRRRQATSRSASADRPPSGHVLVRDPVEPDVGRTGQAALWDNCDRPRFIVEGLVQAMATLV